LQTHASGQLCDQVPQNRSPAKTRFPQKNFPPFFSTSAAAAQGCQIANFQTKNPNMGKFRRDLQWKMFVYIMVIWSIVLPFGIFCGHLACFIVIWYILPVLVSCTNTNLATMRRCSLFMG
jgi:hypothetical protein